MELRSEFSQTYLISGKQHEIQFMALSDLSEICFRCQVFQWEFLLIKQSELFIP